MQRLDLLLDSDSFQEIDQAIKDGVIIGFGKIFNQQVALYAQDFSFKGGSLGVMHGKKICKIMDMAYKVGCPIIGIIDSGGARINEGINALALYGDIFFRNVRYSGVIPQISIILGPCAGGAAYSPALTDFVFTTENISHMFVTGPLVIEQVLHQKIDKQTLGGALVHNQKSGVAHFIAKTEEESFQQVKKLLSYLPKNYLDLQNSENFEPNYIESTRVEEKKSIDLSKIVPQNPNQAYDIKDLINIIFDKNSFFQVQELFAPNIVIGFAKLAGVNVGIIANQPCVKAGIIDIDASCKAARFINFCNNFSIPIISLVDVPGFMPGLDQEQNGIIRHGAKLLYAYANATVPKITLILRKAFGGAYIVMGSKHLSADFNLAWPSAQIAVMGSKGAVAILHKKKLNSITDENEKEILQKNLEAEYELNFLNPSVAAQNGYIDKIIDPEKSRQELINALQISLNKIDLLPKKKNGNIPL